MERIILKSKSDGCDANTRRAREKEKTREEEKKEDSRTKEKKTKVEKLDWPQDQPNPALGQKTCKSFNDQEIICHIQGQLLTCCYLQLLDGI